MAAAASLLAATALAGCSDDVVPFVARPMFTPDAVLAFGPTNVATEKRLSISVFNAGNAGLQILDFSVSGANDGVFEVEPAADLLASIAPGATSTIAVTYRPCPAAWNGDQRNQDYDLTQCPGELEARELVLTDNSPEQTRSISLSGQPVQPPNASFRCVQAAGSCNMPSAQRSECVGLQFGQVVAGSGMPCDLYLEIVNSNRTDSGGNDIPVAPLTVERAEIKLRNISSPTNPQAIVDGEDAGFSLLSEDGQPLSASDFPLVIPVPQGASSGSEVIRVRFDGESGDWIGSLSEELGLRILTDDPQNRLQTVLITASGSSPDIEVIPRLVDFGPVEQGRTATATISIRNQGNAELDVTSAMLETANPEFTFRAQDGMNIARTVAPFGGRFDVIVSYAPSDAANDREFYLVASNDPTPEENPFRVELRGGPTPAFCFEPSRGVLEFPIPDPPTGEARTLDVSLQSCGTGNLRITGLNIVNSNNPDSIDDFRIDRPGCETLPCSPNIELCPQNEPNCTINGMMPGILEALPIVYQNNDTSTQDLAELVITTSDPSNPEARITLDASDNPCLPPTINVEVVSPAEPCVPSPVVVRATGAAGGPVGGTASLANCDWTMVFGTTFTLVPDNSLEACSGATFIPLSPGGLHLLTVTARNSCGAESTSPPEQINVAPNCN